MRLFSIRCVAPLILGLLLALPASRAVSDVAAQFDQGNKFYEQGKFAEASQVYESLVNENKVSPAVYFNLGNALFKTGQAGRAIYYYRLAQRLAPRDPDVLANLSFARSSVGGPSAVAPNIAERFLQRISLDELAVSSAVCLWLWFFLLILGRCKLEWKDDLRPFVVVTALALIVLAGLTGVAANDRLRHPEGIVTAHEAVVRYGPLEESQSAYTLHSGAEVTVLDQKDDWIEISDRTRRSGWLLRKQAIILPRG